MTFITRDGKAVPDIYTWRKHVLATQAQAFGRIFKLSLSAFLSARGLNMNEFCWKIGADPQKAPWRDVVAEKYGAEGLAFMDALLETLERPKKITPETARTARSRPDAPQAVTFASAFADTMKPAPQTNGAGSLGAMFADEPAEAPVEEAQEEQPKPGGFASLFTE